MGERVVLVPGVGLGGIEMVPLALRLLRKGFRVSVFWHLTGRRLIEDSATRLRRRVEPLEDEVVHFVGHSLGGLVVLRMMADHAWNRAGKVVTIGTPHGGLGAAQRLARLPGGRRLLWRGVRAASNGTPIGIPHGTDLGVVAGDRSLFFGSILAPGPRNDILVGVEETRHPESHAHVTLHETHVGMLLSSRVAALVESFLREGRFPESGA